jgi:hypothetical protein
MPAFRDAFAERRNIECPVKTQIRCFVSGRS